MSGLGVLVSLLAMLVSRVGVLLRLFVLAKVMMMGGLMNPMKYWRPPAVASRHHPDAAADSLARHPR